MAKKRSKHTEMIDKMARERKMICEYCGAEKEGLSFFIGASVRPEWVMVEGTGKIACPNCHSKATAEGRAAVDRATAPIGGA